MILWWFKSIQKKEQKRAVSWNPTGLEEHEVVSMRILLLGTHWSNCIIFQFCTSSPDSLEIWGLTITLLFYFAHLCNTGCRLKLNKGNSKGPTKKERKKKQNLKSHDLKTNNLVTVSAPRKNSLWKHVIRSRKKNEEEWRRRRERREQRGRNPLRHRG